MKVIDLKQDSREWLSFRKEKIGASDAPVIMGVSPFKTPYQLWQEKLSDEDESFVTEAMQRGKELEPYVRDLVNQDMNTKFFPIVVESDQHNFMIASLDGYCENTKQVLEIKCPGLKDHELAKSGVVPEKYYAQLQHQLCVCDKALSALYVSYFNENWVFVRVEKNISYIEKMIKEEKEFYKCVQNLNAPRQTKKNYREIQDNDWFKAAEEFHQLNDEIAEAKKRLENLKNYLIETANYEDAKSGDYILQKIERKGSIDYSSIPEFENIDIDKYRKPPCTTFKLSKLG